MKFIARVLCVLMLSGMLLCAQAEEISDAIRALIPSDADILEDQAVGNFRVLTLELPSGETLELTWDLQQEKPLSLNTLNPVSPLSDSAQSRQEAERVALEAYPGASVLFAEDPADGGKLVYLLSETLCGEILISDDDVISRRIQFGTYARDGVLTMEGALAAMNLYRPNAKLYALELDEDDGQLRYEGNAILNETEYEFELDAQTFQLLEWERD